MEGEPSGANPENQEAADLRPALIDAADHLLLEKADRQQLESLDDEQIIEAIHQGFQQELRDFYLQSGLGERVKVLQTEASDTPLDDRLLDLVAAEAGKKPDADSHAAHRYLPKLLKEQPDKGYECTVGSAMLKLALEESGYKRVHALHLQGHQAVVRRLPAGALKIYDPATRYYEHGSRVVVQPAEVQVQNQSVDEGHGRAGDAFTVRTNRELAKNELFTEQDGEGYAVKKFYAFDAQVYVGAGVLLENMGEIKDDAKDPDNTAAQKLIAQYPELEQLDWPQIKEKFKVFDSHDYLER